MKKYIFVVFVVVLFSCQQEKIPPSEDSTEAIKAIVVGETYAYMEKDYQKWASYWDHGSDVLRLDVSKAGFAQKKGWDESGGKLELFFKENPEPITSTFENSNYLIFYDVNLAWVAFDQTWTSFGGDKTVAKATATLVKKANAWKIVSYTAIQYETGNQNVDTLGRE
ncbi:hypothetical protein [Maribacter antarcticus]|uniref:hypothetical protein n=1 Tax=Maribacter antarcticus TaxID=505250 RepID=UPI00047EB235|nr:hypothetical protein [Maribacter antarcticus]